MLCKVSNDAMDDKLVKKNDEIKKKTTVLKNTDMI